MKEAVIDLYIPWHKSHPFLKILQKLYGVILDKVLFPFYDGCYGEVQALNMLVAFMTEVCKK